jgi:signal transduction histidine kinase
VTLHGVAKAHWKTDPLLVIATTARRIVELRNMEHLAREIVLAVKGAFGYDFISLLVVDAEAAELVKLEVQGLSREKHIGVRRPIVPGTEGGVVGWVAYHGKSALVPDVENDPRYIKTVPGASCELAVPLQVGSGTIGVLDVECVRPGSLDEHDRFILETLGAQIAIAIENSRLYEELARAKEDIQAKATQLQSLLARTVDAQEEERRRIARDIHDSVMQLVVGSLYQIDAARISRGREDRRVASLAHAQALLKQCVEEMSCIVHDLRPPLLHLGLESALERYGFSLIGHENVDLTFHVKGTTPGRLSALTETAVYRVVQEALANAIYHSRAETIRAVFEYFGDRLVVVVEDDGCGFDATRQARPKDSLGLTSMEERATAVGGVLSLHSAPSAGTVVRLQVPLVNAHQPERDH